MPIYEYRCSSCGFQKEYLQKVSDPVLTQCPECGKATFAKMLTAAGFQLKGSGWYATDFKNSGAKPAAKSGANGKSEGKSDGKSEAKSDGKSETKSDGKSETKSEAVACGAGACPSCS
jgi:putative FmdB family regulatory protein